MLWSEINRFLVFVMRVQEKGYLRDLTLDKAVNIAVATEQSKMDGSLLTLKPKSFE